MTAQKLLLSQRKNYRSRLQVGTRTGPSSRTFTATHVPWGSVECGFHHWWRSGNEAVRKTKISILLWRVFLKLKLAPIFWGKSFWNVCFPDSGNKTDYMYLTVASLGDTRSLLQRRRDAAMPWDAGVSGQETPGGSVVPWAGSHAGPERLRHLSCICSHEQPLQPTALYPSVFRSLPLLSPIPFLVSFLHQLPKSLPVQLESVPGNSWTPNDYFPLASLSP